MVRSFVRSVGLRASVWSSDSFSSLCAGFTLAVHIHAFYNESVQRHEQHAGGINTIT